MFSQTYNFDFIGLEKGLPQSQINCIKEDTRGYLWFGTQGGGVACYDGVSFKVYDESNGLAGNMVTAIDEDANGTMWFGSTYGGVTRFDGQNFFTINQENGLLNDNILSLLTDAKNRVHAFTPQGLSIIEGKNVYASKKAYPFFNKPIQQAIKDLQGNLWFLADNKLYLHSDTNWFDVSKAYQINNTINDISLDNSGNMCLWVQNEGLFILSKKAKNKYQKTAYAKNNTIEHIATQRFMFDSHNNLWLATQNQELIKVGHNKTQVFNSNNGLAAVQIGSMYEDRSGNVWLGTQGKGIIKYAPSPFIYYGNLPGFDNDAIFGILSDSEGNLWVSPNGNEVLQYNGATTTHYNAKNGLDIKNIRIIKQDKEKTVWVGGGNGLFYIKNKQVQKFKALPDSVKVRSLLFDTNGTMWVGSNGQGIYCFEKNKLSAHYGLENGLTHNYIHILYQDSKGIIWIGTGGGINYFTNNKIGNYHHEPAFCNDYIGSITEDLYGNMYFGTDRCLVQYNRSSFKMFTQKNGLTSATIFSLITDNIGNVWVGTNKGIDKLSIASGGEITRIKNYSYLDGFIGIECNSRAVTKGKRGNLFFATIKGIIEYLPTSDITTDIKPVVHITGIDISFKPFDFNIKGYETKGWFHLPENPTFKYNQNNLTFKFVGINNRQASKMQYQYMLEGFNNQWTSTPDQQATYTNLKPGSYTFKVKAYTDSPYSYTSAQYHFYIATPFWQSAWFYIVMIGGLIFGIFWLIQYRTYKAEQRNKELEAIVQVRIAEVEKKKKEIEYLFKEVHHRVKNNLQVINSLLNLQKNYIDNEEALSVFQDCQNRIYTMSSIHEKLYQNSELSTVNFNEYIKNLIKHLIHTYQINYNIKYHIDVHVQKMDLDTIIPVGLLINEIISNSLKYAFSSNDTHNLITFKMKKNEDHSYTILIGDNGVGSTVDINQTQTTFGMELIKTLTEQLQGTIKKIPQKGTMYEIVFMDIEK
ncbi:MAG: hypothetical protein JST67_04975 [Bacteroidetes bacterium]|nr:hypothetical protein [Bacteroidota bacterium]